MERFLRQTLLPEWGLEAQHTLAKAHVLVVGVGGLGCPVALYLAAAGVGHLTLVDDDVVSLSNLQRQVLFTEEDVGQPKVQVACRRLQALHSHLCVSTHEARLDETLADTLLADADVVVDGSDNFKTRFLLNDAAVRHGKPLVSAALLGFELQLGVFYPPYGPCYRCLYPAPPTQNIASCQDAGVLGPVAGVAGTLQAVEALKMVLGPEACQNRGLEPLLGRLWCFDARTFQGRLLSLPQDPECSCCSKISRALPSVIKPPEVLPLTTASWRDPCWSRSDALFLDVRDPSEVAAGQVDGALCLPLTELLRLQEPDLGLLLPRVSKDTVVGVYCQHGVRSQLAVAHLRSLGYQGAVSLEGGYAERPLSS